MLDLISVLLLAKVPVMVEPAQPYSLRICTTSSTRTNVTVVIGSGICPANDACMCNSLHISQGNLTSLSMSSSRPTPRQHISIRTGQRALFEAVFGLRISAGCTPQPRANSALGWLCYHNLHPEALLVVALLWMTDV